MSNKNKIIPGIVCGIVAFGLAQKAGAQLVQNGGFELTSVAGTGQLGYNITATGWTVPPPNDTYAFLFTPGSADTTGANSQYGNVTLWGPGTGVANGLTPTSPNGGNFIGQDGNFQDNLPISQVVNGLTPNATYTLSFYWAAAQQTGFTVPATSDVWSVGFGSQTQQTPSVTIPTEGFSGWMSQTMTFTADAASDTLSFMALAPGGAPPILLLDGVSLTPALAPDATSTAGLFSLAVVAIVSFGARMFRRRQSAA